MPLYEALSIGCTSAEADIWREGHDLLIGHSGGSFSPSRTLQSLSLNPLLSILRQQYPTKNFTVHTNESTTANEVYTADSSATLTLLIDIKTFSEDTFPVLVDQLSSLRSQSLLTHFDGSRVLHGPLTVVATGNTDFSTFSTDTAHRDVFFDAPLGQLRRENSQPSPVTTRPITHTTRAPHSPKPSGRLGWEGYRPSKATSDDKSRQLMRRGWRSGTEIRPESPKV